MKSKIQFWWFHSIFKDGKALQSTSVQCEWIRCKKTKWKQELLINWKFVWLNWRVSHSKHSTRNIIIIHSIEQLVCRFSWYFVFHLLFAFRFVLFRSVSFRIIINCPIRANGRQITYLLSRFGMYWVFFPHARPVPNDN